MKTQISRDTFAPLRHYSGVQLQQGRMIVDADWNELSDIVRDRLESGLDDAISSGAPRTGGLELFLDGANLRLRPGRLYVDGVPAHDRRAGQRHRAHRPARLSRFARPAGHR
jgi:hypothetical protein